MSPLPQAPAPTLLEALRALVARYELDGIPNDSRPAVETAHTAIADADIRDASSPTLQPGETYAGVLRNAQGQVQHHLILLAAVPAIRLTWQAAMAWAESMGGALPTRQEQALLFANCRSLIKPDWHWSSNEASASFAWFCHFSYGSQGSTHKSYEGCARAVRRA